jgi:RND family efflux transporter MFP subunit
MFYYYFRFFPIILLILLLIIGCNKSTNTSIEPTIRPVQLAKVQAYSAMQPVYYPGILQEGQRTDLGFEITGTIKSISVDLGDSFRAGQTLAKLDPRSFDIAINHSQAQLELTQAEATNALTDLNRKKNLVNTGAISATEYDTTVTRLAAAQAAVSSAEATLRQSQKSRQNSELVWPFAGQVNTRLSEPGQTISAGQGILNVAPQNSQLEINVHVSEKDIGSIAIGDMVPLTLLNSGDSISARVSKVAKAGSSSQAFPVTLITEQLSELRGGMGVQVQFGRPINTQDATTPLMLVPEVAVQASRSPQGDRRFVYVLGTNDRAEPFNVTVKALTDQGYVLSKGPAPGTRIITYGAVQVTAGETVHPLDTTTKRYAE